MSKMTKNKLALLALAGLGAVASGPAFSAMTVESDGGIEVFDTENKDYWFSLGGRLFFDQVWFNNDDNILNSNFPSGSHIRSARLNIKGGVGKKWIYKFDINFIDAPNDFGGTEFDEAFVGYNVCPNLWFAAGQVSIPFGLENWASLSDIAFMEISLPSDAFSPNLGLGLYGEWYGEMFTVAAALYHPQAGNYEYGDVISSPVTTAGAGPNGSAPGSDKVGFGARITFSPVHNEYTSYHAGVSGRWEDLHPHSNIANFTGGNELRARQTPRFTTNVPPNSSDSLQVWGAELAGGWGPLVVSGEYMWAKIDRDDLFAIDGSIPPNVNLGGSQNYNGYYIAGSYVLTGETRQYDFENGVYDRPHPKCRTGAWEVAARYSFANLIDSSVLAQQNIFTDASPSNVAFTGLTPADLILSAHNVTLGLNWYVNDNVRFMANYVRSELSNDTDIDAFGLRAQVTW